MTIWAHTRTRLDLGHPHATREAQAATLATMAQLPWPEHPITFDKSDQPEHSVDVDRFLLVINIVLRTIRAIKIFMYGGSDSNLIYWVTFERLRIGIDKLCLIRGLITRIVPGRLVMPLGIIDLRVTFGEVTNYRQDILSFEVMDF